MIKQKKRVIAIMLLFSIGFSSFVLSVHAQEPTRSKYYHTVATTAGVVSGVLEIHNSYVVSSGTGFSNAEIHTYVERRVLGVLWIKVDNGQPNKTWIHTSTNLVYGKDYSLTLSQTGTYRVTAEYTFNGSNGSESPSCQQTVTY